MAPSIATTPRRRSKRLQYHRTKSTVISTKSNPKIKHSTAPAVNNKKNNYGVANLFTQITDDGIIIKEVLRQRNLTPKDVFNTRGRHTYIDSNVLNNAFSLGGTKKCPLAAISVDNKRTWRLGVMLELHPNKTLFSYAYHDNNDNLIISNKIHEIDVVEMTKLPPVVITSNNNIIKVKYNTLDIHYLNKITTSSICSEDGFIQCSPDGPDRDHDISQHHIDTIRNAISTETPIVNRNLLRVPLNNLNKKVKTLAKEGRRTVFCEYNDTSKQQGFVVSLPPEKGESTRLQLYFLSKKNITSLLTEGETDECRISINKFKSFVKKNATSKKTMDISTVPEAGLLLESTDESNLVGTIDEEELSLLEPSERKGYAVAQWVMGSSSSSPLLDLLLFMHDHAYGTSQSSSEQRRVTSNFGCNRYYGTNTSSRRRPTPRNGRSSLLLIERWRENFVKNALFIPLIQFHANILTVEANNIANASDPVLYNFTKNVLSTSTDGIQVLRRNHPGSQLNGLKIITAPNDVIRGFANQHHTDPTDDYDKAFNKRGKNHIVKNLQVHLDKKNVNNIHSIKRVRDQLHLLRLADQGDGNLKWSLRATCGYNATYVNDKNRYVSALFVYNDINQAVSIPINRVAYNSWDTQVAHQTAMPYTYDDKYIYINDKGLSINAWGCGKGANRRWLQENHPEVEAQINGRLDVNHFMSVITNPNNITNHNLLQSAVNANLPGITQTTIDQWLETHGTHGTV